MNARAHIRSHQLRSEADWWLVRQFIVDMFPLTPPGQDWEVRRWDGYRFHSAKPIPIRRFRETVRIWETAEGIIGVAHPEGRGEVHLEVHPGYRLLEPEMLEWGESTLCAPDPTAGGWRIATFALDYDTVRRRNLRSRGWIRLDEGWVVRRLRLAMLDIPPTPAVDGYTIRSTEPDDDDLAQRMADVLNAGFGRTSHTAAEYETFMTRAPIFSHRLNLVAEAPDGTFAAHVGCNYDEVNGLGVFEPVCTHPDHRRRGLARALMVEGLHRFLMVGAREVHVETGDAVAANELYDSVGFTEAYRGHVWRKTG